MVSYQLAVYLITIENDKSVVSVCGTDLPREYQHVPYPMTYFQKHQAVSFFKPCSWKRQSTQGCLLRGWQQLDSPQRATGEDGIKSQGDNTKTKTDKDKYKDMPATG